VVVNQALAAGLPLLCSDAVGAAHDLIVAEENGLTFAAGDEAALEDALRRLAASPELCRTWGDASRRRAADWTPQRGAQRWADLCRQLLGGRRIDG
jgi:glycosyltransferase involved in cell wall biosynthesis